MITEFHLKYRPSSWDQVVGQKSTVLSLRKTLSKGRSRTFLFTGPSGVGKTTLARLVAAQIGCTDGNILELDGATNTGIDDMRNLMERLQFATIDGSPRCVILDEVHAISQQAFKSLLKILEEPPNGVHWCLCTTEGDRIPKQIRTRCAAYSLRPVDDEALLDLLQKVKEKEGLRIPDEGLDLIVDASEGSPRQALVYLAECGDFRKLASIRNVLTQDREENAEIIEICRLLLSLSDGKSSWKDLAIKLRSLAIPAESARIIILRYMNTVVLSGGNKVEVALKIMSHFENPFLDREGLAPLTLACARLYLGED